MTNEPPPATHFAAALGTMEASKPRCPVCGRTDYNQGKPTISSLPISLCCNGTCSPDCARTKATVDAFSSLGGLIRALMPPEPHNLYLRKDAGPPEVQWVRCSACHEPIEPGTAHRNCAQPPDSDYHRIVTKI